MYCETNGGQQESLSSLSAAIHIMIHEKFSKNLIGLDDHVQRLIKAFFHKIQMGSLRNIQFWLAHEGTNKHIVCPTWIVEKLSGLYLSCSIMQFMGCTDQQLIEKYTKELKPIWTVKCYPFTWKELKPIKVKGFVDFFKHYERVIEYNHHVEHGSEILEEFRYTAERTSRLIAIDIEAFQNNHCKLLEVGLAVYQTETQKFHAYHFIVQDNLHFQNRNDLNQSQSFNFGESRCLTLEQIFGQIRAIIGSPYDCLLIGHNLNADINFLKNCHVNQVAKLKLLPIIDQMRHYDTQLIFKDMCCASNRISLENLMAYFGYQPKNLHNAGNDALCTIAAAIGFCGLFIESPKMPRCFGCPVNNPSIPEPIEGGGSKLDRVYLCLSKEPPTPKAGYINFWASPNRN